MTKQIAPAIQNWLDDYYVVIERLKERGWQPTPENAREGLASLTSMLVEPAPELPLVQDTNIDHISLRIFHPNPNVELPVMVFLHGGGHMAGSIEVYDPICRKLAYAANCIVVAVDYRLAPEHPYPAGLDDAKQVIESLWLILDQAQVNYKQRLLLVGDSAGGMMIATLAHDYQASSVVKIDAQILIYPSLDHTSSLPSIQENASGYLLHEDRIAWYFDHYLPNHIDRKAVSPLFMPISGYIPRTLVITTEFDPLRDEGFVYTERLKQQNVSVDHVHFDDMIHAFLNMEKLAPKVCEQTYQAIAEFVAQ